MALARRTGRRTESNIWAGFVDAMTALLLVMMFVLSIFMILQFMLRETILGQGRQLATLETQISQISAALGATRRENETLSSENEELSTQVSRLQFEYDQQSQQIADFETQIASLIARQTELQGSLETAQSQLDEALSDKEKAEIALANVRDSISDQEAQARLDAAKAEALQAMIDDLQAQNVDGDNQEIEASVARVLALANQALADESIAQSEEGAQLRDEVDKLTELEQQRLAEAAATDYLRERLKNSENEITAMTLALEEERKKAEETLTLLAALQDQKQDVEASDISEAEKNAALLKLAQEEIALRDKISEEDARRLALLNQQTAELRGQLNALQGLLDAAAEADAEAEIQIATMGSSLNAALARAAAAERARANELEGYRSEFFGKMRQVLEGVAGIEIVGDRFVFSSEVLFPTGSANLSAGGREQISKVGNLINQLQSEIPEDVPWVIRVDGHTDIRPITSQTRYADNWELSQARALSVVRYMISNDGVDPARLAPTGFGEYHPIDRSNTEEGLARNRRIEFKLTEE